MLQKGTGAVSRYKLSRSQKFITVQEFNCGQVCVSGCKSYYKFVMGAGANKNRDKLIKHTVRVSCWAHFKAVLVAGVVNVELFLRYLLKALICQGIGICLYGENHFALSLVNLSIFS